MLKHVVLYKLKDGSEQAKRALTEKFLSMRGKIAELIDINAGFDIVCSERSYDVALVCTFEDRAALDRYAVHPVHLPVKEYVHSVIQSAHSVDFIY